MRRKTAICVLAAAVCILLGCIYALLFGESGFLNSERRAVSGRASGNTGENTAGEAAGDETDSAGKDITEKDIREEGKGEDAGEMTDTGEANSQNEEQGIKENAGSSLVFSRGNNSDMERMVPSDVLDVIDKINAGESLGDAVGMEELEGYYALTTTHMIIAKDKETEKEATGSGRLILYVPNLLGGLQDVSALVYDCGEKEWKLIPADVVDVEKKMVSVTMNGSGVVTTVHRVG